MTETTCKICRVNMAPVYRLGKFSAQCDNCLDIYGTVEIAGEPYNLAPSPIALRCRTCTRTDFDSLAPNGQCGYCYDRKIGWKDLSGESLVPTTRRRPFGNCSICKVAFGRTTAKVEIDKVEYCFSCWDELKRTGRVDLTRRPMAPELFPHPVNMPELVEMRPKRQIQLED